MYLKQGKVKRKKKQKNRQNIYRELNQNLKRETIKDDFIILRY